MAFIDDAKIPAFYTSENVKGTVKQFRVVEEKFCVVYVRRCKQDFPVNQLFSKNAQLLFIIRR